MEAKLFEGEAPEYTTPEWYAERETAPHLEQDAHRGRLELAAQFVRLAHEQHGVNTMVDLGCGDGGLLSLVTTANWNTGNKVTGWGYDLQQTNVDAAKVRNVDVRYGDVLEDAVDWADLANMTEMLEHLVDPHGFLRFVRDHAEVVVCSSPYTETAESHYGFHTWAWDRVGYHKMIHDAGYAILQSDTWSMFQVVMAVRA